MLFIILYIIFCFHSIIIKKAYRILYLFFIIVIMTSKLNEEYNYGLLSYPQWALLISSIMIIIQALFSKSFFIDKFDTVLLLFFFVGVAIPTLFHKYNMQEYGFGYYIPVKLWMVYKIIQISYLKTKDLNRVHLIFIRLLLFMGFISALVGILRFFSIPYVQDFIENTWPIISNNKHVPIESWRRLSSTFSGTNGSGNGFALLSLLSLYLYNTKKEILFLFFAFVFIISVILSGSFSSMATLIIVLILFRRIFTILSLRYLITSIILIALIFATFIYFESLSGAVQGRFASRFQEDTIIPSNLAVRIQYWIEYSKVLTSNYNNFLFGLGPGGFRNTQSLYQIAEGNPESFYFYILGQYGFISLILIFVLFIFIMLRARNIKRFDSNTMPLNAFFSFYLISGIANPTLFAGFCNELFSYFVFICWLETKILYKTISDRILNENLSVRNQI